MRRRPGQVGAGWRRIRRPLGSLAVVALLTAPAAAADLLPCGDERLGPDARCGSVSVPEDPANPDGRRLDLRVVLLPATGRARPEPVFMLAGGPGQAAGDLADVALGPLAPVREHRDFVLVDQRGSGGSNRIDCATDSRADPRLAFGRLFDPEQFRGCLDEARQHARVELYSTRWVVQDLEAVRRELGYERVLLWGASGGTRTALVYMRAFPGSVAGALLDGIAPTNFRAPSGFAPAAQRALDRVFADCADQSACREAFPELAGDFAKLLARFDAGPVATTVDAEGGPVSVHMHRGDFGYTVRALLYNSRRIARLPRMIHRAATTGDLSEFAQAHWLRDVNLRPVVAMGVHFAVYCAEDLPFLERHRLPETHRQTFLGDYMVDQYAAVCEVWPAQAEPPSFARPVESEAPVLLFSGHYDPSTPDHLAEEVAGHLRNSLHVVARDEGHGAQFGCGRPAAIRFLIEGSLAGLEDPCAGATPIAFETGPPAAAATGSL